MALFGFLQITTSDGGYVIKGSWSARRTTELKGKDEVYTYDCQVLVEDEDLIEFELEHQYDHGVLALTAKVFAHAQEIYEERHT